MDGYKVRQVGDRLHVSFPTDPNAVERIINSLCGAADIGTFRVTPSQFTLTLHPTAWTDDFRERLDELRQS